MRKRVAKQRQVFAAARQTQVIATEMRGKDGMKIPDGDGIMYGAQQGRYDLQERVDPVKSSNKKTCSCNNGAAMMKFSADL